MQDLIKALIKARAEFDAIAKNAKGYNYNYATLAEVMGAVTPSLTANGLIVVQPLEKTEQGLILKTQLWHESGQYMESTMKIPDITDMQKLGSAITYSRRYALSSLLGICPEDDDGALASEPKKENGNGNKSFNNAVLKPPVTSPSTPKSPSSGSAFDNAIPVPKAPVTPKSPSAPSIPDNFPDF